MNAVAEGLPDALRQMRGFAVRVAGQDADDLLQQTALRALKSSHQFTPGTNLQAWLYVILRNEWLSRCRSNVKHPKVSIDDIPAPVTAPEQFDAIAYKELRAVIAGLPQAQRDAVNDVCVRGLGYEEAAAARGVQCGTIKSRLWRGRAAVKRAIA